MRSSLLFLFLSFLSLSLRAEDSFFSPLFERLDRAEMEARYARAPSAPSAILLELFLAEAARLRGAPHTEAVYLSSALARCAGWGQSSFESVASAERGRAAYACALAEAQGWEDLPSVVPWRSPRALQLDLRVARESSMDEAEKMYAEGRLALVLPASYGRDVKKAIFRFAFLEHLRTDLASPIYWLGRAYLVQGNEQAARETWARAALRSDARTGFHYAEGKINRERAILDGVLFAIKPRLAYSPSFGFGGGGEIYDEALFDTSREAHASVFYGSRGVFEARGAYEDAAVFAGFRLRASASYFSGTEDFYGLGASSPADARIELQARRAAGEIVAARELGEGIHLAVGWRVEGSSFSSAPLSIQSGLTYSGAIGEMALDTRDSRFLPRRGTLLLARGYFPTQTLLSPRTFSVWEGRAEETLPLGRAKTLAIGADTRYLDGDAPYGAYARLGGNVNLPGVRAGRLQDRNLLAIEAEYRQGIWGGLSAGLFSVAGTVASAYGTLFSTQWNLGGGAALILQQSGYLRPSLRLEAARFAGETIVQAAAGAGW